jgi:3-oxoacyl-[acyl-carrier-protein] synthase III
MTVQPLCSLSGLACAVGASRALSDLDALPGDGGLIGALIAHGFQNYAESSATPPELGASSAQKTLAQTGQREQIDAVVYASNSMWRKGFYGLPDCHRMVAGLGLPDCPLFGIYLSACSNAHDALRHARNMIAAEGCGNVLVIVSDVVQPGRGERLKLGDYAVLGDAAASFLVHPPGRGEYDLLGLGSSFNAKLSEEPIGSGRYLIGVAKGSRQAVSRACAAAGIETDQIHRMVMSNLQPRLCRATARALGFSVDQWHAGTLTSAGHCYAADGIMNLLDLEKKAPLGSSGTVLVYTQSIGNWGAAILRKA